MWLEVTESFLATLPLGKGVMNSSSKASWKWTSENVECMIFLQVLHVRKWLINRSDIVRKNA